MLAGAQTGIAERALTQAERNVAQINERVARGVAPEFEKLRAQVTVANRRALHTRARNAETTTQESLKRLIGVPLERPLAMADSLAFVDTIEPLDAVLGRALAARRDLAAARRAAQSAQFEYRARAANDMPLLYFDANAGWQGETSDGLWPGDRESASSASIGLTLAWPIFDALRNRSETRAARAEAEAARLRVVQVEEMVRLEVRSHWAEVQSIAEEFVGAQEAHDLARRAYAIAQVRYHTGMSTLIELLDAELALIEAALNVSETLYRHNVALAQLAYSAGQGPRLDGVQGEERK
jgi:outer membrane protein TolC